MPVTSCLHPPLTAPSHVDDVAQKEQHRAEIRNLQASFEQQKALLKEQLAHAVRFASDQKASFDQQMAKALLDTSNMRKANEQMACEHASDQKKAGVVATQVRVPAMGGGEKIPVLSVLLPPCIISVICYQILR